LSIYTTSAANIPCFNSSGVASTLQDIGKCVVNKIVETVGSTQKVLMVTGIYLAKMDFDGGSDILVNECDVFDYKGRFYGTD
jgi:hypothetical protein